VRARAEQLHPAFAHDGPHYAEGAPQVVHRLACVIADTGHHFDGVAQQFLVHVRGFADLGDHARGLVGKVTGLVVDQRELPLDAYGRPLRAGERDVIRPQSGRSPTGRI
jgi:hypothetical protein